MPQFPVKIISASHSNMADTGVSSEHTVVTKLISVVTRQMLTIIAVIAGNIAHESRIIKLSGCDKND
jgi:hypothetical protein